MKIEHCIQGTQEWFDARNGRVTASRINDVMAYLKSGRESQKRIDYKTELIAEILTGEAQPHYVSEAMKWGAEQEALAATEYELDSPFSVDPVGFVYHPAIERAGASPDRLVGTDGLLEVTCPNTTTHIEWILAGVVPEEHRNQMQFQMRCCEREWADFMSFDPRLPKRYQQFIVRLPADEAVQDAIDDEVQKFLAEADAIIAALDKRMPALAAAKAMRDTEGYLTDEDFVGLL